MPKTVIAYKSDGGKGKKITKHSRTRDYNFLKYWRIVRYWAKRKYNITDTDLEILLYLYDLDLFTRNQYKNFEGLLAWDKTRFNDLQTKGYIVQWREGKHKRQAKLYTLSVKAKRICSTVYKKLLQEELIPENKVNNPIFKGDNYMDKVYRAAIRRMNADKKEREKQELLDSI